MSALLTHVLPNLSYVAKEHLVGMLTHWPHTNLEEASQWWPVVLKSNHPEAMAIFQQRFAPEFWETPRADGRLPLAQALAHARKTASKSAWEGAQAAEAVSSIAEQTPDPLWADPTVVASQQQWLWSALPLESALDGLDGLERLTEIVLARARFDVNAPMEGVYLGSLLRHPRALEAWLAAGGDLHQAGWDMRQPEHQGWEVLAHQHPGLREALAEQVPELQRQRQDLDRQDRYWARLLPEKKTADERWKALLSEPDWDTFRSPRGHLHPLWCALQSTPAILPKIVQAARQDPQWRTRLQARDAQGAGLWESLVRIADSRSVTTELLDQLSLWVPPSQERSVLLQGLRNALQPNGERRGRLVIHTRKAHPQYPGTYTFELARSVNRHLGAGWLGTPSDQMEVVRLIQAHPPLASKAMEAVVEHELTTLLIPQLRTVLLHHALTKAIDDLPKANLYRSHEQAYDRFVRALGMGEVGVTPSLATAIRTYREAFDQALTKAHGTLTHQESLKVRERFGSIERHAELAARPAPVPPRPRRRS